MTQTLSTSQLSYAVGLKTDTGQQRSHNEDAAEVFELPGFDAAFVVCDGMGGLRAGDVASKEAVRVVQNYLRESLGAQQTNPNAADINAALRAALVAANEAVNALNQPAGTVTPTASTSLMPQDAPTQKRDGDTPAPASGLMGTTCVAGVVQNGNLHLAHAGDSRGYLFRGGQLTRLTEDHSFVAERVKAGDMTEAEARVSRFRNMITRAIGIDVSVDPEVQTIPLQIGDTVLVCSDGLTTMVEDAPIAQSLAQTYKQAPEKAAAMLIDMANKKGGEDNITVLVLRAAASDGSLPAPVRTISTAPAAVPAATASLHSANVLDMDAPSPRRGGGGGRRTGGSPVTFALLGAALGIALLFAALALSADLRHGVVRALTSGGVAPTTGGGGTGTSGTSPALTGTPDYAKLAYDPPARFADYLARGDILTYGRGEGLFFVASGSGKVASLSKTGTALHSVATVDIAPPPPLPISPTRLFAASDAQGNVYLSYTKRKVIEKKSPDGRLLATLSGFEQPEAVAVDEDGNLYVVDFNQIKICRAHPASAVAPPKPSALPSFKPAATGKGKTGSK